MAGDNTETGEIQSRYSEELPITFNPEMAAMMRVASVILRKTGKLDTMITVDPDQPYGDTTGEVNLTIHHNVTGYDVNSLRQKDIEALSDKVTGPILETAKTLLDELKGIADTSANKKR